MSLFRKNQVKKCSTIILCSLMFVLLISLEACTQEESQPPSEIFSLTGPRLVYLYRNAKYSFTVLNTEKELRKAGEVTAALSQEFDFISSSPKGVFTPANGDSPALVVWQLGDIALGGKVEIELKLMGKARGQARIYSKLTFSGATLRTASLETKVIGVPVIHISTYDTEDPVEVGNQTIYVIEARNEGTSPSTNVIVKSELPAEMEFVSAEGPVEFDYKSGSVDFDAYPILQPGEKLVYKVVCKSVKSGSAKHTATLTYDQFEKPIIDEEGTSCYE